MVRIVMDIGHWNDIKNFRGVKDSALMTECKYPREQGYKVVWLFDHSSCHGAYA